jgi:hypothetical protein
VAVRACGFPVQALHKSGAVEPVGYRLDVQLAEVPATLYYYYYYYECGMLHRSAARRTSA